MQTTTLDVRGMSCATCVTRVEAALDAVPGVERAEVDFATSRAHIEGSAPTSALRSAIEAAGYEVVGEPSPALDRSSPDGGGAALEAAEAAEQRTLWRDFILAAVLGIPAIVIGMAHGSAHALLGPALGGVQFGLVTPIVWGPGSRFIARAWRATRQRSADMNTLVSLGVLSAWTWSTIVTFAGTGGHVYFEAAAAIVLFVLFGKLLEARARRRLSAAVRGLMALVPDRVVLVEGDGRPEREVDTSTLKLGDRIRIRPGDRVPLDGVIVEGHSAVDESMLTGESMPVDKVIGDAVHAGTLNSVGTMVVEARALGGATTLAGIVAELERAHGRRAPIARLADRVAGRFVPIVLAIAVLTLLLGWALEPTGQGLALAVERFVAVLVIACPCAVGLATPAAVAVGTGRAATLGILIRGGAALESASRIDTVFFDKTGTLTEGRPVVSEVHTVPGYLPSAEAVLGFAAAVEAVSEHPLAKAIVEEARRRGLPVLPVSEFEAEVGLGVRGRVGDAWVVVGNARLMQSEGIELAEVSAAAAAMAHHGRTPAFVAIDGVAAGVLGLADRVSPAAARVIAELHELDIEVAMATGDRPEPAQAIADQLGITRVYAGLSPRDKADRIAAEVARGHHVAMVGDGINDAPALATATLGVAVGGASEVANASADVALLGSGVERLPAAFRLARATMRNIRQNLGWAFVYNVVCIPVAAGVLLPWTSWQLSPVWASAAMALSSVSVLANALRLRRFEP